MWLNWSVATINATLQLLDIYRFLTHIEWKKHRLRINNECKLYTKFIPSSKNN